MQAHGGEALRRILLTSVFVGLTLAAQAQNVDVNAERVSMDAALLRAVRGETSVGSYAIWPSPLQRPRPRDPNQTEPLYERKRGLHDAYDTWVNGYYGADDRFHLWQRSDSSLWILADGSVMARGGITDDGNTSETFALGRPSVRVMGSIDDRFDFMLDMSNGMKVSGTNERIARTEPVIGRTFKFQVDEQKFFDRYIGYVQFRSEHLRVRFGREALQFGFSPIDNFVHSIDAPPMDGLLVDVPFDNVRFTFTHHQAEGTDTSGRSVPGKYIATHRLSVDPWPWLSVSVSDMIVYWNRGIDLAYLNPLAFFVSAGLGTKQRSETDNSILGFDVAVRPADGTMIYASLIADDIAFSTLSDTSYKGNNNKYAYQLGATQALRVLDHDVLVSAEVARITPFTFSHRTMNAAYTHLGAPVGYDMQPNSDRLALQLRWWFTPRTSVRIDVDYTRHGENLLDANGNIIMAEDPRYPGSGILQPIGNVGGDISRGDGDFLQGNRFLRGNVSHQRRIDVHFTAEWWRNVFTDVRIGISNRNGGNTPGSFAFGSVELRLGY